MAAADKVIRIGGGSAFLVDSALAVPQLLRGGRLHYLIFDYLAEASMGLLGRFQAMDPKGGFGADFLTVHVGPHLAEIARQGIKVVANAGGLNPRGLVAALEAMIKEAGLILRWPAWTATMCGRRWMACAPRACATCSPARHARKADHQRERLPRRLPDRRGAAAGRRHRDHRARGRQCACAGSTDPRIRLANWRLPQLAAGTLAGHLLECGAQVTGGTFTDWRDVPMGGHRLPDRRVPRRRYARHHQARRPGGLVSVGTVAEQLLYEVSDPSTTSSRTCAATSAKCTWSRWAAIA